jgi:hypothetical protein
LINYCVSEEENIVYGSKLFADLIAGHTPREETEIDRWAGE